MRNHLFYISICVLFASAIAVRAQSSSFPEPTPMQALGAPRFDLASDDDPVDAISRFLKKKIIVVTNAKKTTRHSCVVENVSAGKLICAGSAFHARKTFRVGDIAALIEPAKRYPTWVLFSGWFGTGAGLITGACFLASVTVVGAIPVALLGGMFILTSPITAMASDDDVPERLLYVRSGFSVTSMKLH